MKADHGICHRPGPVRGAGRRPFLAHAVTVLADAPRMVRAAAAEFVHSAERVGRFEEDGPASRRGWVVTPSIIPAKQT